MTVDLAAWLSEEARSEDRQAELRQAFLAHPMRILVIDGILRPERAQRVFEKLEGTRFIRDFGTYAEVRVSEEVYNAAGTTERFYRYGVVERTGPRAKKKVGRTVASLLDFMESDALRDFISTLTATPLGKSEPANLHAMGPGDFLRPHNDRNDGRRFATVMYLNQRWAPSWGGSLRFLGDGGFFGIEPRFNRLVCFDVNTHVSHHIDAMKDGPPEQKRYSAGTWFHDPA